MPIFSATSFAVALADRAAHHLGDVVPVAEQEGAVEEAPFGESAARPRRSSSCSFRDCRAGSPAPRCPGGTGSSPRCTRISNWLGAALSTSSLKRSSDLRQEVRRRRGGREAEQDLVLRVGGGDSAERAASTSPAMRRIAFMIISPAFDWIPSAQSFHPSCPRLSRASMSCLLARSKTWMAGPSPRRSGYSRTGGRSPAMTTCLAINQAQTATASGKASYAQSRSPSRPL